MKDLVSIFDIRTNIHQIRVIIPPVMHLIWDVFSQRFIINLGRKIRNIPELHTFIASVSFP
jgi:hypothetical protein